MKAAVSIGLIVLAVLAGGSAGAQQQVTRARTLRTPTPATVAADGSMAAVATNCGPHMYWLYAWSPLRRSVVSMARPRQRECYGSSTGEGVWEQGIGGRRLAWVAFAGGNTREFWLRTATIGKPRSTAQLVDASHGTGSGLGGWVGNVRGDGSLLVFNTWSVCETRDGGGDDACPEGFPLGTHVYDEKVWRIVGRSKRLVLASADEATVLSVAAGRILLRRADGTLELRRADGSLLRSFVFRRGEVRAAVLDVSELVVLDGRNPWTWRVFDPATGAEKHTLPVARRAIAADVERGLLVYRIGRVIHLLRLADGRDRKLVAPAVKSPDGYSMPVRAELEPAGLFFSYQVRTQGRVRFVPFDEIGLSP
jgi:hypothetical protein